MPIALICWYFGQCAMIVNEICMLQAERLVKLGSWLQVLCNTGCSSHFSPRPKIHIALFGGLFSPGETLDPRVNSFLPKTTTATSNCGVLALPPSHPTQTSKQPNPFIGVGQTHQLWGSSVAPFASNTNQQAT